MKIVLNNNVELDCTDIVGTSEFVKGAKRNCLVFNFFAEAKSIDELLTLFKTSSNTENITIYHNDTDACTYTDYTILENINIKDNVIAVKMGQLNYGEKQEKERIEQLNYISEVIADMLGGAL